MLFKNKHPWLAVVLLSFFLILFLWIIINVVKFVLSSILEASPEIAAAAITAFSAVVISTITVMIGRHFERRREIEAHFREKKIELYEEFMRKFFEMFHDKDRGEHMVEFLREWQRTIILRADQNVVDAYFKWMIRIRAGGQPNAEWIYLMDNFFREMRKDIGLSSWRLAKGSFVHTILKNSDLFLDEARKNPNLTFSDFENIEIKKGFISRLRYIK